MSTACKRELQDFLEQPKQKECHLIVAPDFFLDRIVTLPWHASEFSELLARVAARKGGSLDGISQNDLRGGNAINVASGLTKLGVTVTPIVCTSNYGLEQIKYHLKQSVDLSHIKIRSKASITTALELKGQHGKTNVMLRDLASLADFGPDDLEESDYELLEQADYICLFNWAGTLNHGTEFAQIIFSRAKRGKGKTYYDTADPTPNKTGIADLVKNVLKTQQVDILSLNENEAVIYASFLDADLAAAKQNSLGVSDLAMEAARVLTKHFSSRIDLHTTDFSATLKGTNEVVVPTFNIKPLRATGAGDAWCAGNLFGYHNSINEECRLMLANAVSACYLSEENGSHPTKAKVLSFLKKQM